MKSIKVAFIGITVLLMIIIGVFYFTIYSSFTETSLAFIEIQYLETTQGIDQLNSGTLLEKHQLSKEERELLFQSLELKTENIVENHNVALIEDANRKEKKKTVHFSMRLVNRFNQEKRYNVYLKNQNSAYIKVEDSLYEIEGNEFYYSHRGFDPYYRIKYLPKIEIGNDELLDTKYSSYSWQTQRYDGTWIKSSKDESKDHLIEEEKIHPLIEREEDHVELIFNEVPDEITYIILNTDTKEEVAMGMLDEIESNILPTPDKNGKYDYQLEAFWDNGISRNTMISLDIDISRPVIFTIDNTTIFQDEIIEITANRAATVEDITVEGDIAEDLQWYREDQQLRTVIPTNYHTYPGMYSLKLKDLDSSITHSYDIEILPRDYKTQYLSIDSSIEEQTRNEEAYEERDQYFSPVRKNSSEQKYYEDDFLLPTEGRLTTEFGERRYVNDELTSYRHNGIDIAAPLGTEILATNHGEVVFEREMILMGNTIVIDHGHGLFSTYLHLDDIQVDTGDWVEKGNVIGTLGTTGFSTGPHLHFTMSYYETPLEPGYFIIGKPYTKEDHYQISR